MVVDLWRASVHGGDLWSDEELMAVADALPLLLEIIQAARDLVRYEEPMDQEWHRMEALLEHLDSQLTYTVTDTESSGRVAPSDPK